MMIKATIDWNACVCVCVLLSKHKSLEPFDKLKEKKTKGSFFLFNCVIEHDQEKINAFLSLMLFFSLLLLHLNMFAYIYICNHFNFLSLRSIVFDFSCCHIQLFEKRFTYIHRRALSLSLPSSRRRL